jgi:hypothetical protein
MCAVSLFFDTRALEANAVSIYRIRALEANAVSIYRMTVLDVDSCDVRMQNTVISAFSF